jgi:hypothetical protein
MITTHTAESLLQAALFTVFDQDAFLRLGLGADPQLQDFSLVFLDEIHERNVVMDVCFGLLVRLQAVLRYVH